MQNNQIFAGSSLFLTFLIKALTDEWWEMFIENKLVLIWLNLSFALKLQTKVS